MGSYNNKDKQMETGTFLPCWEECETEWLPWKTVLGKLSLEPHAISSGMSKGIKSLFTRRLIQMLIALFHPGQRWKQSNNH